MVFSSHLFVFYFLPLVLAAYWLLPSLRWRNRFLAIASYGFYGWANPVFLPLMLASTVLDYGCGRVVSGDHPRRLRRLAVAASVVGNLSLLAYFKYAGFLSASARGALQAMGWDAVWEPVLEVTLPVGISFYTFQSMSYTLDLYRGRGAPQKSFGDFACYVAMFPQLVAGPILRYREVAEQLRSRSGSLPAAARGASFFCLGMAKKVLLANPCGEIADLCFAASSLRPFDAWIGAFAYGFQIYFDFSGYSDMAIGLGLLLGFRFPKNFDSPYRAVSITDFWRRWHISLSAWLRDYLYIPLGGSRQGRWRTYRNLAVVMLLGGLWHGAAWNFVAWGAFHGGLLAVERWLGIGQVTSSRWRPLRAAVTFLLVTIGWVLFRADDLPAAGRYLGAMFALQGAPLAAGLLEGMLYVPYFTLTLAIAALVTWRAPQTWDWTRSLSPWRAGVALVLFASALSFLSTQGHNPFIYFRF
ncbi:MAG: MBOAT family protein [Acidobacteriota bacterium]